MKCWDSVLSALGKSNYCPPLTPCGMVFVPLLIWAMLFGLDGVAPVFDSCFFASETALAIPSCLPS